MRVLLNQAPIRYPGPGSILIVGFCNQSIFLAKTGQIHWWKKLQAFGRVCQMQSTISGQAQVST